MINAERNFYLVDMSSWREPTDASEVYDLS